eukprot:TRINITY_DN83929_c0_g1_i1.p1 TRINITY_DN83929_c0_g1~~TRINITY_DN83929_c0_g1_i1.p1  ORF type:complete len:108 (-),score=5.19 TRINITY_DN83929_c0_g1_i1:278-601(-)
MLLFYKPLICISQSQMATTVLGRALLRCQLMVAHGCMQLVPPYEYYRSLKDGSCLLRNVLHQPDDRISWTRAIHCKFYTYGADNNFHRCYYSKKINKKSSSLPICIL